MLTMTVEDLKAIVKDLPNDMEVIIPVVDQDDVNKMYAFRRVRTAGILSCVNEEKPALCLNGAADDMNILEQINHSKPGILLNCRGTECIKVKW